MVTNGQCKKKGTDSESFENPEFMNEPKVLNSKIDKALFKVIDELTNGKKNTECKLLLYLSL